MSESSPPNWIQDPFWGTEKGENQDSQVQQDASGIARKVMFWGVKLATDFAFKRGFYEAGGEKKTAQRLFFVVQLMNYAESLLM